MLINVISIDPDKELHWTAPQYREIARRSREQRMLSVCKQSKLYGLNIRFWEGITSEKTSRSNISLAHKQIVSDAKEKNLKSVCIAEDDFLLSSDGAWQYFLDQMPNDFDLYLSGIYSGEIKEGIIMNGFSGLTLYVVNKRFYDFFLSANSGDDIDRWLGNYAFEKKYIVCQPFVAKQISSGYSDHHKKMVSHQAFLKEMKFFEGV